MAMRERKRDQLTLLRPFLPGVPRAAPSLRSRPKHFGGQLQRIPPVPPKEANKKRIE